MRALVGILSFWGFWFLWAANGGVADFNAVSFWITAFAFLCLSFAIMIFYTAITDYRKEK